MAKLTFGIFAAAVVSVRANLSLVSLKAVNSAAVCTDGSPAAYYWKPAASDASSHIWIMHLEGGGWCYNQEDCESRCGTPENPKTTNQLCSSTNFPSSLGLEGLFWPTSDTMLADASQGPNDKTNFLKTGAVCDSIHQLDCHGNDLETFGTVSTHEACCAACEAYTGCNAWTWDWKNTGNCYLKSACTDQRTDSDAYHSGYATSPSPPSPPSPPAPPSPPSNYAQIQVVSYNLYWWCVSNEQGNCQQNANGAGFAKLYEKVKEGGGGSFDLIGFQECDNIAQVLGGAGLSGQFDYYDAPGDAKMAWDNQKYTKIGGPGQVWVASDQYGNRYMDWVRLQVRATGQTIFFANTHGPLNGCGSDLGDRYVNGINSNRLSTDTVVLTGDFNCGSSTAAIATVSGVLQNAATGDSYGGADHIFTSFGVQVQWQGHVDGSPSDHSLLKAVVGVAGFEANQAELVIV